jgi:hypothetical protein
MTLLSESGFGAREFYLVDSSGCEAQTIEFFDSSRVFLLHESKEKIHDGGIAIDQVTIASCENNRATTTEI